MPVRHGRHIGSSWMATCAIHNTVHIRWSGFKFVLALSYSESNISTSYPTFTARAAKGH